MPTYEELLAIIAKQNEIIERLTAELASAKAEIAVIPTQVIASIIARTALTTLFFIPIPPFL